MKKKLLVAFLAIISVFCLAFAFTACNNGMNGTYYPLNYDGTLDTSSFIKLKGGNWEDDEGTKGTYKTDGNKIRLYVVLFGESEVLAEGTVENGVLSLDMGGVVKEIYVSENHGHNFGEWSTIRYNCLTDGLQRRICACGVKEEQILTAIGHHNYGEWITVKQPCAQDGLERRTCICGQYEELKIEATGEHIYSEWVVTKEPGLTEFGQKERRCTVCDEKVTQTIDCFAIDFYNLVDIIKTKRCYSYAVTEGESRFNYGMYENIVRYRINGSRIGTYFEILSNKVYKYEASPDGYYHKKYATYEEIGLSKILDLNKVVIKEYNQTDNYYSVEIEGKSYKMVVENNSITFTYGDILIKFYNIGTLNLELPGKNEVWDETV